MSYTVIDEPRCIRIRTKPMKSFVLDVLLNGRDCDDLDKHQQKLIVDYLTHGIPPPQPRHRYTASSYNPDDGRHYAPKGGFGMPKSLNGSFYASNDHHEFRTLLPDVDQSGYPSARSAEEKEKQEAAEARSIMRKIMRKAGLPVPPSLTPTQAHAPTPSPSPKPSKQPLPEIRVQPPSNDESAELRDPAIRRAQAEEKWHAAQKANALVAPSYDSVIQNQDAMALNPNIDALLLPGEQAVTQEASVTEEDADIEVSGIGLDDTIMGEPAIPAEDSNTLGHPRASREHDVTAMIAANTLKHPDASQEHDIANKTGSDSNLQLSPPVLPAIKPSQDSTYGSHPGLEAPIPAKDEDEDDNNKDNDNDKMEVELTPPPPSLRKKAVPKKLTPSSTPRRSTRISELHAKSQSQSPQSSQSSQPSQPSALGKRARSSKMADGDRTTKRGKRS